MYAHRCERLMQIRVTQYPIEKSHRMCLFSPQADQPHAVIEVQQLFVVELVDGHVGEEIAGVSKQTPTSAVAANAASYAPSAATAVVSAYGAK